MPITFNGTEVTAINYNGTAIEVANYNGVEVFRAGPRPTDDSYFTFTLQSDNTYSIKAKSTSNMPETLVLPSTHNNLPVTTIERDGFRDANQIKTVIIPSSIKTINDQAFYSCYYVTKIEINDGVTTIGNSAFRNCPELIEINIPDTVTSMGNYQFNNDTKLSNVTLSNNLTNLLYESFSVCTSLSSITLPSKLQTISSYCFVRSGLTSITIPDSVTSIATGVFRDCPNLSLINIGSGLQTIETEAFSNCVKLTAITVSESNAYFKSVYGSLYSKDGKILHYFPAAKDQTSFIVADGTEIIKDHAIYYANKLTTITLPASLKEMQDQSIAYCYYLNPLSCKALTPPKITALTLYQTKNNCVIQVPAESVDAYKAAQYWSERARYIQAL